MPEPGPVKPTPPPATPPTPPPTPAPGPMPPAVPPVAPVPTPPAPPAGTAWSGQLKTRGTAQERVTPDQTCYALAGRGEHGCICWLTPEHEGLHACPGWPTAAIAAGTGHPGGVPAGQHAPHRWRGREVGQ